MKCPSQVCGICKMTIILYNDKYTSFLLALTHLLSHLLCLRQPSLSLFLLVLCCVVLCCVVLCCWAKLCKSVTPQIIAQLSIYYVQMALKRKGIIFIHNTRFQSIYHQCMYDMNLFTFHVIKQHYSLHLSTYIDEVLNESVHCS